MQPLRPHQRIKSLNNKQGSEDLNSTNYTMQKMSLKLGSVLLGALLLLLAPPTSSLSCPLEARAGPRSPHARYAIPRVKVHGPHPCNTPVPLISEP